MSGSRKCSAHGIDSCPDDCQAVDVAWWITDDDVRAMGEWFDRAVMQALQIDMPEPVVRAMRAELDKPSVLLNLARRAVEEVHDGPVIYPQA